jgi:hypothetical protein
VLRDGNTGSNDWERIGTDHEDDGLRMEDYMTYDEVKLAALLQVSSPVFPINA